MYVASAVEQPEHFPPCAGETSTLSVCNQERAAVKTLLETAHRFDEKLPH